MGVYKGKQTRRKTHFPPRKWPKRKNDKGQEKKERKHALDQESKILEKKTDNDQEKRRKEMENAN